MEFPVTISLAGDPETGDVSLGTLSVGWNLIANPFAEDIDFTLLEDGSGNLLNETGSVWDPNEGATGSYVLTSSSTLNNKLSVWQGAFIELGSETEVVVPEEATTTGAEFLKEQELLAGQIEFVLEGLDSEGNVQTRDRAAQLYFHENAKNGWDRYDVSKLTPLSQEYATIAFVGKKNNDSVLNAQYALPYNIEHSHEVPLEFQMSEQLSENGSSSFQLSWPVAKDLPEHVEVWLSDLETGQKYNLREVGSIEFADDALQVVKRPSIQSKTIAPKAKGMAVTGVEPRFVVSVIAEGEENTVLPQKISLNQNYPNPFNPTTQISYELPETANVRLEVFDLTGRRVSTLVDEQVAAGTHQANFDASNLSSGVYLYRLQTANAILTKKLTLIK